MVTSQTDPWKKGEEDHKGRNQTRKNRNHVIIFRTSTCFMPACFHGSDLSLCFATYGEWVLVLLEARQAPNWHHAFIVGSACLAPSMQGAGGC